MRNVCHGKLFIRVALPFLFVFILASKTFATTETKLLASDGAEDDWFGHSVSIGGDVALVGAELDSDKGTYSGAAYVFRRNGSTWTEEDKLLASDGLKFDYFGSSVSISGEVALVGAYGDDDNGTDAGAAYVFRWDGESWVEEQKLLASDSAANDQFGSAVSISGNVALVGAYGDNVNGTYSGSAYIFRWDGESWVEEDKLLATDSAANDWFGSSVSISGDVALVGALWHDDNGIIDAGAAYIFRWNGSIWVEEDKLLASDGALDDRFGSSVSIRGDVALVGAYGDDDNSTNAGAAYVFRWDGERWVEEDKLLASDGSGNDYFGSSVSISGDVALVGAYLDDDNGGDSGSAYLFKIGNPSTPNKVMPWIPLLLLEE